MIMMDWRCLVPIHSYINQDRYDDILKSVEKNGWNDRPLLAIGNEEEAFLITGTHRWNVCKTLNIEVPVELLEVKYFDWYDLGFRLDTEIERLELINHFGSDLQKNIYDLEEE